MVWPIAVAVVVFIFTTVGYFTSEEGAEKVYAVLSVLSFACAVVEVFLLR